MNIKYYLRWVIVALSFVIISIILWNTYVFFQKFKTEERIKIETWSLAQSSLLEANDDLTEDIDPIVLFAYTNLNTSTPMILVEAKDGSMSFNNIDDVKTKDSVYVAELLAKFEKENTPIPIRYKGELYSTIYYGNSVVLNKLKYYPLTLILVIGLFGAVAFFFYRSTKVASQNKLWTGMAKETAHQIGTPLSSLVGWAELLKIENVNPEYITEIEKDIDRLIIIAERFSKIGSVPKLEKSDIVIETIESYEYLKTRFSNLIDFQLKTIEPPYYVNLNRQLFSWTIENLVKNAIDAMKGKGVLKVVIEKTKKEVLITITDTGKGIEKAKFKTIFEPGYTSKKRGWGLGLSLAKRIIEDYHNGKIKVISSQINKGTSIQISLNAFID